MWVIFNLGVYYVKYRVNCLIPAVIFFFCFSVYSQPKQFITRGKYSICYLIIFLSSKPNFFDGNNFKNL